MSVVVFLTLTLMVRGPVDSALSAVDHYDVHIGETRVICCNSAISGVVCTVEGGHDHMCATSRLSYA